jgi:hypothetical protein
MTEEHPPGEEAGISMRSVEIAVSILLFAFGATVVFDSNRLGSSWGSDGPQSGYFPFYIGLLICISAIGTLVQVLLADYRARSTQFPGAAAKKKRMFVAWGPLRQVFAVLIPSVIYVVFVQMIGIYVSSAVFIAVFMVWLGKYSWFKSIAVGLIVSIAMFAMFEIWFKVPLWRGTYDPLAWLGY